jgi:ubiquinone/menaquinone biosynthesis methyltransferase
MTSFRPGDAVAVEQLFDQIAPHYDQLNDLLSLGLHRLWKRQALAWLQPSAGQRLLDLCCGTGDMALLLATRVRPEGRVLGVDAAAAPLAIAARRASALPWLSLDWLQADAQATGLAAGWGDGAVMAYGLRNLADPAAGLRELRRLLRPGGRAAVLDFNRPQGATAGLQRLLLRQVVVPVAGTVGLREHYAYLEESLQRFPTAAAQEELARSAGFSQCRHRPLAAGLMGLLELVA